MDNKKENEDWGRTPYIFIGLFILILAISNLSTGGYYIINQAFLIAGLFIFGGLLAFLWVILDWWRKDAKKDGKPTDLLLWVAGTIILIPLWFLLVTPTVFGGTLWLACDVAQISDKYFFDSPCFDFHYRCTAECGRYSLNFTGVTDGCACDCGKGWVSSCSGFYYDKEPDGQDLIRIVGDEIVEYPNGTVEPADYESGVYAFNKSEPMIINEKHKVGEV